MTTRSRPDRSMRTSLAAWRASCLRKSKPTSLRSIDFEVQQSGINYKNAWTQYNTQKGNLELADDIYKTTLIKYNEGVGSSLEVANAQSELFTTQSNYINALFELLNAKTDLDKALGNN